jgi:2,4-diketo-3-deoxy-L-fuconate hydrolase
MKICRFNDDRIGVVEGDSVIDVTSVLDNEPAIRPGPLPMSDWLIENLDRLRPAFESAAATGPRLQLADVKLLSPVANPSKIIGAPVNYDSHHAEANADKALNFGTAVKTVADYGLFLKANSSLVGPSEGIELAMPERRHDHEGELVVVIGKPCRAVSEADALDYVAGYCIGLDMTARGPEERSLRKSMDTYSVLGPWLVTADEIADPDNLDLKTMVGNELRQNSNTKMLIFSVRRLISYASDFYTLLPGDVIMTGTPSGVGPVLPGNVVKVDIEGLGTLESTAYAFAGASAPQAS